jgi:hypothetical protein
MRQDVLSTGSEMARRNPAWGAQLVVLGAILLDLSLPSKVTFGPPWLLPTAEGLALLGFVLASPDPRAGTSPPRRRLAIALVGFVTAVNAFSVFLLVHSLLKGGLKSPKNSSLGHSLILAGVVLWVTNVLLVGIWYWLLDRGGPAVRGTELEKEPDFLFPQMADPRFAPPGWKPSLLDYMYVSFTNAAAFSPTDTMPLTINAKVVMSAQAIVALVTIGLVVARAVNILT